VDRLKIARELTIIARDLLARKKHTTERDLQDIRRAVERMRKLLKIQIGFHKKGEFQKSYDLYDEIHDLANLAHSKQSISLFEPSTELDRAAREFNTQIEKIENESVRIRKKSTRGHHKRLDRQGVPIDSHPLL